MGWSIQKFVVESLPIKIILWMLLLHITITELYLLMMVLRYDGVSLTHDQSPRQHIWTFANAVDEIRSGFYVCPCTRPDLPYTGVVPPFISQDYFCETGSRQAFSHNTFYPDDPLWDG